MKKRKKEKNGIKDEQVVNGVINIWEIMNGSSPTDTLGSYRTTQYGYDNSETEQDIDDE